MKVHSLASRRKADCTPALATYETRQHHESGQLLVFPQSGITRIPEDLRQAAECLARSAFHDMQRRGIPTTLGDCYRRSVDAVRDLITTVPTSAREAALSAYRDLMMVRPGGIES